jgi:anti-sigma B factor antagonist
MDDDRRRRAGQIKRLGTLQTRSRRTGDVHTIAVDGELDIWGAVNLERELAIVDATDASTIVIDLSGVTFVDSSGIRLVVDAHHRCAAGRLQLTRGSAGVQRIFAITGLENRLPFTD